MSKREVEAKNMQTNRVNVFDQTKRKVKCIANEHDYLGDGTVFREDKLEVGKQYTFIKGEVRSYDETILKENYRKWLKEKLDESYYRELGRKQNVAIFKDTERLCKSEKQLAESIRKSIAGQKLILEVFLDLKIRDASFCCYCRLILYWPRVVLIGKTAESSIMGNYLTPFLRMAHRGTCEIFLIR